MAELPLERPAVARPAAEAARERFLTPSMWVALAGFALFALTFDRPRVHDDGTYYYNFVRRLFGADVIAQAYQYGSAFFTAPFYLGSQLVASRGELDRYHAGEVGTAVAANVAGVLVLYLGWRILRELDLPRGAGLLLLVLFGTPLWFYVFLEPGYKHAADTLYLTAAALFLLLGFHEPRRRYLIAAGAFLGLMLVTRYANVAILAGVPVMFGVQRAWRSLWWVVTTAVVVAALLYAVPVIRGISFEPPPGGFPVAASVRDEPVFLRDPAPVRLAAGESLPLLVGVPGSSEAEFDPLVPAKMLFTLKRGLFLWTPLTAFAVVGFVLLTRRDRRHRWYLLGLLTSAVALLVIHSIWANFWAGGSSFSSRFLASLFPVYLIGAAELVRRRRGLFLGLYAVCTVWSVWIGLVLMNGYRAQSGDDSLVDVVQNYTGPHDYPPPYDSPGNFAHELRVTVEDRWKLLWRTST
jgi:Dolichyl-phosphate-mannose-protein mannosyltransferase